MNERQQTIVCAFDKHSPRVSAFEIHEWVYETLRIQEHDVVMIQIDGPMQHVYIKFRDPQRLQTLLEATQGHEDFRHENGKISKVRIEAVGLGMRRVRVACLPPKVEDGTLKMTLSKYGEIRDIQPEMWPNIYRYHVPNGVHVIRMSLVKHIPSHVMVAGHGGLISYEGQPTTCYSCNEPGHIKTECPHRRRERPVTRPTTMLSWAEVAAGGPTSKPITSMESDTIMAAPDNMEAEMTHVPVSAQMPYKEEIDKRDVEISSEMEDEQLRDNATNRDTEGERPHVEGR